MEGQVVCVLCDRPEHKCDCERYCCLCQGVFAIRLCADGQYYCPDCREAMDVQVADSHDK